MEVVGPLAPSRRTSGGSSQDARSSPDDDAGLAATYRRAHERDHADELLEREGAVLAAVCTFQRIVAAQGEGVLAAAVDPLDPGPAAGAGGPHHDERFGRGGWRAMVLCASGHETKIFSKPVWNAWQSTV